MVVLAAVTASVIGRSMLGNAPFLSLPDVPRRPPRAVPAVRAAGRARRLLGRRSSRASCTRSRTPATGPGGGRSGSGRPSAGLLLGGAAAGAAARCTASGTRCSVRRGRRLRRRRSCWCCWSARCSPAASPSASADRAGCSRPACSAGRWPAPPSATSSHAVLPGPGGPAGAYALVGMGAVFAGAARAPITAVVILFELTGEYSIILPLMLAIVLAAGREPPASRSDTIYTRKLLRRGIDIDEPADAAIRRRPVASVHGRSAGACPADAPPAGGGRPAMPPPATARCRSSTTTGATWAPSGREVMDALAAGEDIDSSLASLRGPTRSPRRTDRGRAAPARPRRRRRAGGRRDGSWSAGSATATCSPR